MERPPVQARIDPGCTARRCDHISLIHVESVLIDGNVRMEALQIRDMRPMGRRPSAFEESGSREHKDARADRQAAGAACRIAC
jgi:hypothetical protein